MEEYPSFSATVGNLVFKILPMGFNAYTSAHISQNHVHGTFELHIIFDEKIIFEIDNSTVTLNPDDFILIFPNVMHRHKPADKPATLYAFRFTVEKSPKASKPDYYSIFSSYNEKWMSDNNPLITEYIKKILTYIHTEPLFSEDKIKAFFTLLFTELLMPFFKGNPNTTNLSQETSEYDRTVNLISMYFNHHYMEDISLAQLAMNLNLSQKQTRHIIKKAFRTTFRECLNKIRLKTAKDLLTETNLNINDIAKSVGYQSYNGFYIAFKSKYSMTPAKYREKHIEKHSK